MKKPATPAASPCGGFMTCPPMKLPSGLGKGGKVEGVQQGNKKSKRWKPT